MREDYTRIDGKECGDQNHCSFSYASTFIAVAFLAFSQSSRVDENVSCKIQTSVLCMLLPVLVSLAKKS